MESLQKIVPVEYAIQKRILPLREENDSVVVAIANSINNELVNELEFIFNKTVIFEQWEERELLETIYQVYQLTGEEDFETPVDQFKYVEREHVVTEAERPQTEDHSVILLADKIISDAIRMKASDIHVESYENTFRIRFRIDGKLIEYDTPPPNKKQALISRLKIMAKLDIAEKRRPQDGRISMKSEARKVDIRVSTMPTEYGEKVVLRILDKSTLKLSLESLGFDAKLLDDFKKVLNMPYGMILVTGPTGSGKTTTLYAALNYVNTPDINIITIEDPIEYNLHGINQTNVKPQIGLTFASILRTVLRQDPDIIMVGEIRDHETAEIAIRAALTGHLVLSTLHTNDAISTIIRLIDMGIEPFLVANSLKMVLAQRLVRKICRHCKTEDKNALAPFEHYNLPEEVKHATHYIGKGCRHCNHTGFSGREAIIEYIYVDDEFAEHILSRASLTQLKALAKAKNLPTLQSMGLKKVMEGKTTLSEVISATFVN
ncbi:MAG: type II/IV secretion system protein [Methanobacteriota archaeon]|nr:MAG: type II/IV secretion system protein [Euryarchaeota archaeon]